MELGGECLQRSDRVVQAAFNHDPDVDCISDRVSISAHDDEDGGYRDDGG